MVINGRRLLNTGVSADFFSAHLTCRFRGMRLLTIASYQDYEAILNWMIGEGIEGDFWIAAYYLKESSATGGRWLTWMYSGEPLSSSLFRNPAHFFYECGVMSPTRGIDQENCGIPFGTKWPNDKAGVVCESKEPNNYELCTADSPPHLLCLKPFRC